MESTVELERNMIRCLGEWFLFQECECYLAFLCETSNHMLCFSLPGFGLCQWRYTIWWWWSKAGRVIKSLMLVEYCCLLSQTTWLPQSCKFMLKGEVNEAKGTCFLLCHYFLFHISCQVPAYEQWNSILWVLIKIGTNSSNPLTHPAVKFCGNYGWNDLGIMYEFSWFLFLLRICADKCIYLPSTVQLFSFLFCGNRMKH